MKISSRQIIKEAIALPSFMDSLKEKWRNDPDFMESKSGPSGEEIKKVRQDAVALISKYWNHKELKKVDAGSDTYSSLISGLPASWKEASGLMQSEIDQMAADPVKVKLINLGVSEGDLANKDVRSWLEDRYITNKGSEIHPIGEGLETIKKYVSSKNSLLAKLKIDGGLKKDLEDRGFGEERLKDPITLSADEMLQILNQYEHGGKTTIRTVGVEIKPSERVGKVGEWNIWLPQSQETSAKIAGYDDSTKDPKTTWCTARTKGSNLFYHYISRGDIISFLFYIIKDNPVEDDDWLSLGLMGNKDEGVDSIKPDFAGQFGGITVNRANNGLKEEDFQRILGGSWREILSTIKEKIAELGGENPATAELERYARDLSLFKREFWNKSEEERFDFCKIIMELNPSNEVAKFAGKTLAEKDPSDFLMTYSKEPWAEDYLPLAGKSLAEKYPREFLRTYSKEPWAQDYLNLARKSVIEKEPEAILEYDSKEPWAKPYLDLARRSLAEKYPSDFLRKYSKEPWAENYLTLAGKSLAKKYPYSFLKSYSKEPWAKDYLDLARSSFAEESPESFLEEYSKEPWAKDYLPLAGKSLAKKYPYRFLGKYSDEKWAEPLLGIAGEIYAKQYPYDFLLKYSKTGWAKPYFGLAGKLCAEESPGSFLYFYDKTDWANERRDDLDGKTLVEYAKEKTEQKEVKASPKDLKLRLVKLSKALHQIGLKEHSNIIANLSKDPYNFKLN